MTINNHKTVISPLKIYGFDCVCTACITYIHRPRKDGAKVVSLHRFSSGVKEC